MARNVCMAAIFMMASVVVQANHCSSGDECPSDEQSQVFVSLLQTKLHNTSLGPASTANEQVSSSRLTHRGLSSPSDEQVSSSHFTNGGAFTLQGRVVPWAGDAGKSGVPMSCDIPICSRSCSQGPECCATQMFNALTEITEWMKKNDVEYSVLAGTLLGAYRDKDIIQWTGDLDLAIYSKDVLKLTEQKDLPWSFGYQDSFGIPRGCQNHHKGFPGKSSKFKMGDGEHIGYCSGADPSCSYYMDLYVIDSPAHGGDIMKSYIASSLEPDGHLKQTVVEIRGKEFNAPAEVEDYLVAMYGDWKTPDPDESFHR